MLDFYTGKDCYVVLEKVNAMLTAGKRSKPCPVCKKAPGMGATSAFNFGGSYWMWIALLTAHKLPYALVSPVTWKKVLMSDMGKEKGASIVKASQLYPRAVKQMHRKKDHNRADALLLATYAKMTRNIMAVTVTGPQEPEIDFHPRLF